ncbi:general secretion pathway protein M [Catenovulum agarivorans DS-2]|uniref:General secretion pathway protein M n=1 Tax=Catenovulum agarivorans DS-2 TaxID=1328313 RepID=W7QEC6_9ALTE|nr:type II secretion system protein M [Catenovulum agarivorans]EWH11239.1 general secretion pathway protein M [Catenovulum agarivorans DS-2]
MKQWFESLAEREKRLVIGAAVVFVIGLFFQLIWGPLNNALEKAEQNVKNKQALLLWVSEKTAEYQQLKGNSKASASGSLNQIVNSAARQAGISIARMQPQGDSLQVQIDQVEFNAFVRWLATLVQNKGLTIESLDITETDRTGAVRVRRLQVTK